MRCVDDRPLSSLVTLNSERALRQDVRMLIARTFAWSCIPRSWNRDSMTAGNANIFG